MSSLHFHSLIERFFLSALYSTLLKEVKRFETTFKVWIGPYLLVVVRDADDLKTILYSKECFDKSSLFYDLFVDYGLFGLGGRTYKLHRRTINPVFYPMQLKSFFPIIKQKTNEFLQRFDGQLEPSKEIEFSHHATDFSLDSIVSTLFSKVDTTEQERGEFIEANET